MKPPEKKFVAAQMIGKMQMEPDFLAQFQNDPEASVKKVIEETGKKLEDENELKEIKSEVERRLPVPFLTDPKMRSLVDDITNRANEGYKKVQGMSDVLFKMGVAIIVSVFVLDVYGVVKQLNWQTLIASSGVLGAIGVATIYESTNKLPERVKNSVADLVQIKVAFFGYWDQLSILMGLEHTNADEAIKVTKEINTATEEAMKRIQTYCELH